MKKPSFYFLALMATIMSLSLYSCGDDDNDEPFVRPSFGIDSPKQFSGEGGSLDFYISDFNPYTTVETTVSWISAQLFDMSGRCYISISENDSETAREGAVVLMYKGQTVDRLFITQNTRHNNPGNGDNENPGNSGEFGAPTGLSLNKSGCSVTLSWNPVANATKYYIYHSNPKAYDSGYFVTMNSTASTSFTLECGIAGNWAFKVQAYDGKEYSDFSNIVTTSIYESDINSGGSVSGKPATPTGLRANVNGTQVYVSWNEVKGASYYRLYYVKPKPYDIESFDNIYSTSTTMNCTASGKWTIWVVAVNSDYEASDPSSKVSFNVSSSGGGTGGSGGGSDTPKQLDTPTGLTVNSYSTDNYVQLQCNAVTLGHEYQLYRSTSPNSGYSKINASVGTNSSGTIVVFTDSNPKKGTTYYKVKVSALSYLGIKDSNFSDYVKVVR